MGFNVMMVTMACSFIAGALYIKIKICTAMEVAWERMKINESKDFFRGVNYIEEAIEKVV